MPSSLARCLVGIAALGLIGFPAGCGNTVPPQSSGGGGGGGGQGGGGGGGTTPSVKEFLYIGGFPDVDIFQFNTANGIPSAVQNINIGGALRMAATHPTRFLYTSDWNRNAIQAFTVASDGTLNLIKGSPYPPPGSGTLLNLALSPDNGALYVTEAYPDIVTGFQADPTTGQLTPLANSISFGGNTGVGQLIVDPSGRSLYAAVWTTATLDKNGNANAGLAAFSIDSASRELTQLAGSPYLLPAGSSPVGVTIDPGGHFVYVVLSQSGHIQGFSRDANTGQLTPFSGAAFGTPSQYTTYVAMHPTGAFLFALGYNEIATYSINKNNGALTEASVWTPSNSSNCSVNSPLVIDPTGTEIFTGTSSFAICVFQIDPGTGALKLTTPSGFPTPNGDGVSSSWFAAVPAP